MQTENAGAGAACQGGTAGATSCDYNYSSLLADVAPSLRAHAAASLDFMLFSLRALNIHMLFIYGIYMFLLCRLKMLEQELLVKEQRQAEAREAKAMLKANPQGVPVKDAAIMAAPSIPVSLADELSGTLRQMKVST